MSLKKTETMVSEPISGAPPRGTHDILPPESARWQHLEELARSVSKSAGYHEIRLPIFEHTELFKRGVGETTDIVNKEMYTFADKSQRSLTLRPEGTAGTVRAYLNGGFHRHSPPVKLWYLGPMFRYEGTQTGRQRQFHQFGVEAFGSQGPLIDAEVVILGLTFLKQAGLKELELQLNSIGCPICRPAYRELLRQTLMPRLSHLCQDCKDRFERNPLRMLDCKSKTCQAQYQDVPLSLAHLCSECQSHWDGLLLHLKEQDIQFVLNPRLVRGLDYYTRTVMEIVSLDKRSGSQNTVCAGGRYDNLVEALGGPPTPAVGWALGLERLLLLLDETAESGPFAFIVSSCSKLALKLATQLRNAEVSCEIDFPIKGLDPRNFSKQLQQANKLKVPWVIIVGEDEIASQEFTLKNMESGLQERLPLADLVPTLKQRYTQ